MRRDRLEQLEAVMLRVHERDLAFSITSWASVRYDTPATETTPASEENLCGTTACAAGWGALDPVLNAQGLKLVAFAWVCETTNRPYARAVDSVKLDSVAHMNQVVRDARKAHPKGLNWDFSIVTPDEETLGEFFGIRDSDYLFMPARYGSSPTALDVAKRIRYVLDNEASHTLVGYEHVEEADDDDFEDDFDNADGPDDAESDE